MAPRAAAPVELTAAAPLTPAGDAYSKLAQQADASTKCSVGVTQLGRGLVATAAVDMREAVVSIPVQNALIIADDPMNSISIFSDRHHRRWQERWGPLPPQLLDFLQDGEARWDLRMAAWLLWVKLQQQQTGSMWDAYLDLLPQESDLSCLLNFNDAERQELQLPSLKAYLAAGSGDLARLQLSSSLQHSLWALSMVRSRTFSEDVNGEMLTLMVPFADLANHSFDHNCTFCLSRDNGSFQLRSLRPMVEGDEATISYGSPKPNSELLRDYGFIVPGNPFDRIDFSPGSSSSTNNRYADSSSRPGTDVCWPKLNPVSLLQGLIARDPTI
eukprot:gene4636-4889_t